MATPNPSIAMLQISAIRESPFNQRKTFDPQKLAELAASIRTKGVLQPVLVRSRPQGLSDGYELVYGHRRLRGAAEAGLQLIPAIVRDLTDKEVVEAQIVENSQREDVHPLEEADGYRCLHEEHGYDIEQIAAKLGKSKAYVYARLKLVSLAEPGRQAFLDGRLTASTALLVARIPDEALQAKAVAALTTVDEPMSFRAAATYLQNHFMLRLEDATFSTAAENLVPGAGACTTCPKRTGAQPELFADVASADVCTDPNCYRAKQDAHWARRAEIASDEGLKVLSSQEAKKIFRSGGASLQWDSPYVTLSDTCAADPRGRTYKQLLGKRATADVIARAPNGAVVELVDRKGAEEALVKAGKVPARPDSDAPEEERRKREEGAQVRAAVVSTAVLTMVTAVEKAKPTVDDWRLLVRLALHALDSDALSDSAERRGLQLEHTGAPREDTAQALARSADQMSDSQLRGLLFELLVLPDASGGAWRERYSDAFSAAAKHHGLDLRALERDAKKRLAAPAPQVAPEEDQPSLDDKPAAAKKARRSGTR